MDRVRQLEILLAIADTGAFARAGQQLGMSPPAVTRAIAALEDRLGARLITRTTRRLRLTDAGNRFLESARRFLGDLETAEREAAGAATMPHGHLTMTASVTFGRMVLTPIVSAFLAAHDKVSATMILADRVVDLVEEGIDVGVRIGALPDSSLLAVRLGAVQQVLVASPAYLGRVGTPRTIDQIKKHNFIGFAGLMPGREIRLVRDGRTLRVPVTPRLMVNDAGAALAAAEAGDGITVALSYMVAQAIGEKRLKTVLGPVQPPPAPVHLVYPQGRLLSSKVRAFVDFARPRISKALPDARA